MLKVNTLPFTQLRNAEHVSFLTNVKYAIERLSPTALGLTADQFKPFQTAVALEQDIVNRYLGSIYTPEMKAYDEERDRLYRLIRLKMQSCLYATPGSELASVAPQLERYVLSKYGAEVTSAAYQEESALIAGFILDVKEYIGDESIEAIGITDALDELESANKGFITLYNDRVTEKSYTDTEATRKLRSDAEEQYHLLMLSIEYRANGDDTIERRYNVEIIGVINGFIKDVRHRLNVRLGKESTPNS